MTTTTTDDGAFFDAIEQYYRLNRHSLDLEIEAAEHPDEPERAKRLMELANEENEQGWKLCCEALDTPVSSPAALLAKLKLWQQVGQDDDGYYSLDETPIHRVMRDLERLVDTGAPLVNQGKVYALGQRLRAITDGLREADSRAVRAPRPEERALASHYMQCADDESDALAAEIKAASATTAEESYIQLALLETDVELYENYAEHEPPSLDRLHTLYETMKAVTASAAAGLRRGLKLDPARLGLARYTVQEGADQ